MLSARALCGARLQAAILPRLLALLPSPALPSCALAPPPGAARRALSAAAAPPPQEGTALEQAMRRTLEASTLGVKQCVEGWAQGDFIPSC